MLIAPATGQAEVAGASSVEEIRPWRAVRRARPRGVRFFPPWGL